MRVVARVEALAALRQLDGVRKGLLIQFLFEAELITGSSSDVIINLRGADLSDVNLNSANLSGADLVGAYLGYANLDGADLHGADLHCDDLTYGIRDGGYHVCTDLRGAYLRGANLSGADLSCINRRHIVQVLCTDALNSVSLRDVNLRGADLHDANLRGAYLRSIYNLTQQQLDQVRTCKDALLPNGLTCHRNQAPLAQGFSLMGTT